MGVTKPVTAQKGGGAMHTRLKKITVFHELKCLLISGFAADALADEKGSGSTTTFEVLSHGD